MALAIWTVLTILAMAGMFGACVVVAVAGIRWLEQLLARGRLKQPQA